MQENSIVKKTTIFDKLTVSTVFLGTDHSFFPGAEPLLFETMIYEEDSVNSWEHGLGDYQERCSSMKEALEQHDEACQVVRKDFERTKSVEELLDEANQSFKKNDKD